MKAANPDIVVEEGSGNVFADLGLSNANALLVKSELALAIRDIVRARGWTQVNAASMLSIPASDMSDLMRGKLTRFGRERERRSYPNFIERMRAGWLAYDGPVLLVLSGDDLSAAEFRELVNDSPEWKAMMQSKNPRTFEIADANHTFSSEQWRVAVERETIAWIKQLQRDSAP